MKGKTAYVMQPTFGIERFLVRQGIEVKVGIKPTGKIDMLFFMGGTDISPNLYGEKNLYSQVTDYARDAREMAAYDKDPSVMKIGICRGAQLLNVLNGGSLWQDAANHHTNHLVEDLRSGEKILVSSIHHQIMIPPSKNKNLLRIAESYHHDATLLCGEEKTAAHMVVPEVLYFRDTNSLCFQPHPEFGPPSCTDYFFNLIKEFE